jgi:tetratricopeptide (TPR) repeat protein
VVVDAEVRTLPFTVDARQIPQSVKALAGDVAELVKKGRYTKVRLKLGSRPILPDIPVGVALAAGGLTAALVGPLQAVLGTMVGQIALQVELISDAAHHVTRGRELILAGELDLALEQFRTAVAIDRDHAPAHLNIGVALKLKGDREGARLSFERASALDPKGPSGLEAGKLLATLRGRD